MRRLPSSLLLVSAAFVALPALADPVPRVPTVTGQVVQTRIGEEIELVEDPAPRSVEVRQDVKAGDVIATNASGQIAILFADRTQVRLGRNSTLVVKELTPGGDMRLELQRGRLFARAARGGTGVAVETPAATAAIRGTDWTLEVAGERTTLSVLEGVVDLSNPQGRVTVREGEAAAATLGSAPSKVVIAGGDRREQMLFSLSLRDAFAALPATVGSGRDAEADAARLEAVPKKRRSPEERVLAAEVALDRDGRAAAQEALAQAQGVRASPALSARLDLVEGMLAASERRYGEAAALFERARPRLSGERRVRADYLAYFARSLAEPQRAATPPGADPSSLTSVVGEAVIAAFLQSPREALAILKAAEPRFGREAGYQAALADLAIAASDFDAAREAVRKAEALDPNDPAVLSARASYRGYVEGDTRGALLDAREAARLEPGNSGYWNDLGLLESDRGADREAEAAFRRAIETDPQDPVALANYAVFLLDGDRVDEAKVLIDRALAEEPDFEIGYLARGRQQLQEGDTDRALESLLRATAANPTYSNGLLVLGATYAARGEIDPARQAFENADRLDRRDPLPPQYRSALAVDQYEADDAIRFAQESVARTRARGGDFTSIESSRDFGSSLSGAYRFLTLDAWGRFWGDRVFDPFQASGYFDQALSGAVDPFLLAPSRSLSGPDPEADTGAQFSSLVQGLLLDPLAAASSNLRPTFVRTPLNEVEVGGGITAQGSDTGGNGTASVQSLGYDPLPYSLALTASLDRIHPGFADQDERSLSGSAILGARPGPNDRFVAIVSGAKTRGGLAFEDIPATRSDRQEAESATGVLGWSHTFGYRNVLNVAVLGLTTRTRQSDDLFGVFPLDPTDPTFFPEFALRYDLAGETERHRAQGAVSHLLGIGEDVVLRYGAEFGYAEEKSAGNGALSFISVPEDRVQACLSDVLSTGGDYLDLLRLSLDPAFRRDRCPADADEETGIGRIWMNVAADLAPGLKVEGALFAEKGLSGEGDDKTRLSPRLALAYAPNDWTWLRAAYMRTEPTAQLNTLAPVDVLGLRPDVVPAGAGTADTAILRWDAEWTERFFTAAEYQHQEIEGLSLTVPFFLGSTLVPDARVDRVALTANWWIGGGFGAFGTIERLWSQGEVAGREVDVPFLPDVLGRVGLTYVSPERLKLTLAGTYIGERGFPGDSANNLAARDLSDAFLTDVTGSWETPDRHLALEVGVFNVFDEPLEVAPLIPATGRTVTASLKARF